MSWLDVVNGIVNSAVNQANNGATAEEIQQSTSNALHEQLPEVAPQPVYQNQGFYSNIAPQAPAATPQPQAAVPQYIAPQIPQITQPSPFQEQSTIEDNGEDKKKSESSTTNTSNDNQTQGNGLFDILMNILPNQNDTQRQDTFIGSGGGNMGLTPEQYEQMVRNAPSNEELSRLTDQFWNTQKDKMGEAAGMVVPGEAPIKLINKAEKAGDVVGRLLNTSPEMINVADKDADIIRNTFPEVADNVLNSLGPNRNILGLEDIGIAIPKAEDAILTGTQNAEKAGEEIVKEADKALGKLSGASGAKKAIKPALAGGAIAAAATNKDFQDIVSNAMNTANDSLNDLAGVSGDQGEQVQDAFAQYSPEEIDNMTQREMYERLMENEAARDYYSSTYGDEYVGPHGYEYFRDIGDNTDYGYKYGLVSDLLGYNDQNPNIGISPWLNMAAASGIDTTADPESVVRAVMDYMWAPENVINASAYLTNPNYSLNTSLGNPDSVYRYMTYLQDLRGDLLDSYGLGLDANDAAEYAMLADINNRINNGYQFTDKDMGLTNWLMEQAGDTGGFGFIGDNNQSEYSEHQWTPLDASAKKPNAADLYSLNSMPQADAQVLLQQSGYYGPGVISPLMDSSLADEVMYNIQNSTGRQVGRKAGD